MSNRIHRVVMALALTGLAGGALAQSGAAPGSAMAGGNPSPPPGAPRPHGSQPGGDEHGDHRWGDDWHGHHHHHGHWGRGGWGRHGHGPGLLLNLRELDLTSAQREQVHTILSAARQQHANKRPGGEDFFALANPGDPKYAAALQAAKKRAADRIQERSDLQLKLYNILTPQQKTQLTKTLAERKAKMAEWKAKMEQRRAERAKGSQPAPANQ